MSSSGLHTASAYTGQTKLAQLQLSIEDTPSPSPREDIVKKS